MTTNVQKVLEDALTLSPNERAHLAAKLLESLDEFEEDVQAAWAAEIQRRVADARENPGDEEDWREVLNAIQREVLSR
ncbi:MAG TPA: addiction module protein [Thermoanaerobaculia bacterium]|nr:addiction module protein [Thermoanaerobaculia bacterium]